MKKKQLIKAIENPYTTILDHLTGRQLLIRPGYPVYFKKVIDACTKNNVVIELNANPYRLLLNILPCYISFFLHDFSVFVYQQFQFV